MPMHINIAKYSRGGDQMRDGCPTSRHLFDPNYVTVLFKILVSGCPWRAVLI